jgi:tetratricopeptide (TPR) repeat protein
VPREGGEKMGFSLREDGSLLWVMEDAQFAQLIPGKYRLDSSKQPKRIELFDIADVVEVGGTLHGIYELQDDGRLKLEFTKELQPLSAFTANAVTFSRSASPIVPPTKPTPPPYEPPASSPYQPPPDQNLIDEAKAKRTSGDGAGALELLNKAIALNPKSGSAHFWRAMCFYDKKEWKASVADLEKAMELDPSIDVRELIEKTKALGGSAKKK